jgi:hypothetical protein
MDEAGNKEPECLYCCDEDGAVVHKDLSNGLILKNQNNYGHGKVKRFDTENK